MTSLVRQHLPRMLKRRLHVKRSDIILLSSMSFYVPFERFAEPSNRSDTFAFRTEVIPGVNRRFLLAISMQPHTIFISFCRSSRLSLSLTWSVIPPSWAVS